MVIFWIVLYLATAAMWAVLGLRWLAKDCLKNDEYNYSYDSYKDLRPIIFVIALVWPISCTVIVIKIGFEKISDKIWGREAAKRGY